MKKDAPILTALKSAINRWVALGAREEELFEAFSRINTVDEWYSLFTELAQTYEKAADAAEVSIVKATNYRLGSNINHLGRGNLFPGYSRFKQMAYDSAVGSH